MASNEKAKDIQSNLPKVIEAWLQKEGLWLPGHRVSIGGLRFVEDKPIRFEVKIQTKDRTTRIELGNPDEETWSRILSVDMPPGERAALAILKENENQKVTREEVSKYLSLNTHTCSFSENVINSRLHKAGITHIRMARSLPLMPFGFRLYGARR